MAEQFERRVSFSPAFEKRHDDPRRDYGIGCVIVRFALASPQAAISFEVFSGWYLPHVRERLRKETNHRPSSAGTTMMRCSLEGHGGAMYTHHSPGDCPSYLAGQEVGDCDLLPGGKCVGDVGFLIGETLFDALCEGGEDGLWAAMRDQYDAVMAGV